MSCRCSEIYPTPNVDSLSVSSYNGAKTNGKSGTDAKAPPMLILFRRNTDTWESLAQRLSVTASHPRPYYISSLPLVSPTSRELIWSLMSYESYKIGSLDTETDARNPGLASYFLTKIQPGDPLTCAVRAGNSRFRPPADFGVLLTMICAGVGIAPFAGFIADRAEQVRRNPHYRISLARYYYFLAAVAGAIHPMYWISSEVVWSMPFVPTLNSRVMMHCRGMYRIRLGLSVMMWSGSRSKIICVRLTKYGFVRGRSNTEYLQRCYFGAK